jgi:hypothetical protein
MVRNQPKRGGGQGRVQCHHTFTCKFQYQTATVLVYVKGAYRFRNRRLCVATIPIV